jgi:hypothetical protein
MPEPLSGEEPRVVPVASVQLTVTPRDFAVVEIVNDQTGEA